MPQTPSSATTATAAGLAADERGLVGRCRRGELLASAQLVARYQDRVAGLAYRLLGWRGDIEDVVQDVFVSVLQNLPRFRGECRFTTWLYRITASECRRARRKRLLRMKFWRPDPPAARRAAGVGEANPAGQREISERVRAAVRGLPRRYREVVVLRHLEDLPIAEIGQILGLRPNAVEVRLSRARTQLQTGLADLLET